MEWFSTLLSLSLEKYMKSDFPFEKFRFKMKRPHSTANYVNYFDRKLKTIFSISLCTMTGNDDFSMKISNETICKSSNTN